MIKPMYSIQILMTALMILSGVQYYLDTTWDNGLSLFFITTITSGLTIYNLFVECKNGGVL